VFVRPFKVGGSTFINFLQRAANRYGLFQPRGLDWQRNSFTPFYCPNCAYPGQFYANHGFRNSYWTSNPACILDGRFVTIVRDPLAQIISWEVMGR
jgi:predicted nucleic-acid-binding Zn-ribbon protein